jgi:CheY-like chemotaxis protein/Flp pilus assembly protein TadD
MNSVLQPTTPQPQNTYRILVADDSQVIHGVFRSFNTGEIVVSDVVTDRAALIQAIKNAHDLDAVLCADHLAGLYGGVHALNELRERRLLPHETAFILMSGDVRKSNLMVDIEAKPDSILLKPFAPATLLRKLAETVPARRALADVRRQAEAKDWNEVLRVTNRMLSDGTDYPTAVIALKLDALSALGQHEAAVAMYSAILKSTPRSVALLEAIARHAYSHGQLVDAEKTLVRMLTLQPANCFAADLLADILLARGDAVAAQLQLHHALRHSPNSAARHRALGHIALLNNDLVTAQRAYAAAMRLNAEAAELNEVDVANVVRSLLLNGDNLRAKRTIRDARLALRGHSLMLDVLQQFTEAMLHRELESFGKTQNRVQQGIALLERTILPDDGVMLLAATEASLMASLAHRGYQLSAKLLKDRPNVKLHPAQKRWVEKLHKWSRDVHNEDLPEGLLNYQQYMQ